MQLTSKQQIRQPIGHAIQKVEQKMTSITETPTMTTVIKEYPIATHAKNIEYRLSRLSELIALYDSLITLGRRKNRPVGQLVS